MEDHAEPRGQQGGETVQPRDRRFSDLPLWLRHELLGCIDERDLKMIYEGPDAHPNPTLWAVLDRLKVADQEMRLMGATRREKLVKYVTEYIEKYVEDGCRP